MRVNPEAPRLTPAAVKRRIVFYGAAVAMGLAFIAGDRLAKGSTMTDVVRSSPWLWITAGVLLLLLVHRVAHAPLSPELEAAFLEAKDSKEASLFCRRCASKAIPNELFCPSCGAIQWQETLSPILFILLIGALICWILVRQR